MKTVGIVGVALRGIVVAFAVVALPPVSFGQERQAPIPDARRPAVRMMEAVLSRAVLTGAENLAEELGSGNPNMSFFTGQAKARGFVLDGYGIFFHVEIPEMQQSSAFSVTTLDRDLAIAGALASLTAAVELAPDGPHKVQAEQAIKRLQLTVTPAPVAGRPVPGGTVPSLPASIARDPNAAYREAIQSALIDAMLEHHRGMNLGPDEWLSVAAHRGESPFASNEIVTTSTLVLRIKGSDLARYDSDRSLKEEIRRRVEVREF